MIEVACSTGTYIRSIAFDVGRKLGCGAHLAELCRTKSSAFVIENAIGLDELEDLSKKAMDERIIPMSACLDFLPKLVADDRVIKMIGYGQKLTIDDFQNSIDHTASNEKQSIRILDETGELLAIVSLSEDGQAYNYSCVFSS